MGNLEPRCHPIDWCLEMLGKIRNLLNRPWLLATVLLSTGTVIGGVAIWAGASWRDAAIEIGSAAFLGAMVVLFKPRFMREVGETAAVAAADAVAFSGNRPIGVDDIRKVEAVTVLRRGSDSEELAVAVQDNVTAKACGRLIDHALQQGWFAGGVFVRLGNFQGCPLLEIRKPSNSEGPDASRIELTLFMINAAGDYVGQYFDSRDDELVWRMGQDARTLVHWVLDVIDKYGIHDDELSAEIAIRGLLDSYRTMMKARRARSDSDERIAGELIYRINDEWVLTSRGLESIATPEFVEAQRNGHGEYHGVDVLEIQCPSDHNPELWDEAQGACISLILATSHLFEIDVY